MNIALSYLFALLVSGPVPAPKPPTISVRATNDSLYTTVSWAQASDSAGAADYYIVDASVGHKAIAGFPKKVTGLTTTYAVAQIPWGTSTPFVVDLRSVRRGLTSKAVSATTTYKRVDAPPPPPQNVTVTVSEQP